MSYTLDLEIRSWRKPRQLVGDYKNCDIIDLFNIDQGGDFSIAGVTAVFGTNSYSRIPHSYQFNDIEYKRHVLITLYGKPVIR